MPYQRTHPDCESVCKVYTAYIRVKKKWRKIGEYHTICGQFTSSIMDEQEGMKLALIGTRMLETENFQET